MTPQNKLWHIIIRGEKYENILFQNAEVFIFYNKGYI